MVLALILIFLLLGSFLFQREICIDSINIQYTVVLVHDAHKTAVVQGDMPLTSADPYHPGRMGSQEPTVQFFSRDYFSLYEEFREEEAGEMLWM